MSIKLDVDLFLRRCVELVFCRCGDIVLWSWTHLAQRRLSVESDAKP